MARDNERSLADLQQEAERSRADLTETVDQLRSKVSVTVSDFRKRVSPEAMKAEVSDYFRNGADALMDKARKNPLQAAAVGVGVAYPLLRIVRSIPAPVMMVGAGLFLLGSSSGQKVTGDISKKLSAVADGVSDTFGAGVDAAGKNAQDLASSGLTSARDMISSGLGSVTQQASAAGAAVAQLKDSAADLVVSASDGLGDLKRKAGEALGASPDALRGGAATTSSMARDAAGAAADFGTDTAHRVRERAVETSQRAISAIGAVIDQHPLVVGGLGLAVGMLIASALPRSDIEKSIMGTASAETQKRASALASKGFEAAAGVASGALADLAEHVGQEGLAPADLNAAAEDLGRRVRKVAESGTDAAFGAANDAA